MTAILGFLRQKLKLSCKCRDWYLSATHCNLLFVQNKVLFPIVSYLKKTISGVLCLVWCTYRVHLHHSQLHERVASVVEGPGWRGNVQLPGQGQCAVPFCHLPRHIAGGRQRLHRCQPHVCHWYGVIDCISIASNSVVVVTILFDQKIIFSAANNIRMKIVIFTSNLPNNIVIS